jgi:hypothetical protein
MTSRTLQLGLASVFALLLLIVRACRGTEVGCISQRLQPKEHQVLVLG